MAAGYRSAVSEGNVRELHPTVAFRLKVAPVERDRYGLLCLRRRTVALWILVSSATGQPAQIARTAPKTVVDYLLLLPLEYFEMENVNERLALVKRRGSIVDLRKGYLFLKGDGAQRDLGLCLFKRADGSHLVAVGSNDEDDVFNGSFLHFYNLHRGKLKRASQRILPVRHNKHLIYVLPRSGKTIQVNSRRGKHSYSLKWTGDHFERRN